MARPVGSQNPRRPYAEAKDFVRTLNLSNTTEWWTWSKSGQRPPDIPGNPRQYREEFTDWYDWLGNARPVNQRLMKRAQRRAERAAPQKKSKSEPREKIPKAEKIIEPADIQYQLAKYYQQQIAARKASKDAAGDRISAVKPEAYLSAQPRQNAATETPKRSQSAAANCKVRPVWTVCREGHASLRADKLRSAVDATVAAMKYSSAKGYEVFIGECERCSTALGRTVWHVYRDPQNKSAPCRRSMREND